MNGESAKIRQRLKRVGLSDAAINAAWPEWWSDDAEPSISARLDLRFSIARKLGLDARSLVDEEGMPRFVWRDEARFKNLLTESELERAAIASFGKAIGSLVASTMTRSDHVLPADPSEIRRSILRVRPFVGLGDLLGLCWACGVPVLHLCVYPLGQKRMAAMAVRVADLPVILLAKNSSYPASVAFYLAHEIGHIAMGHLNTGTAIVDLDTGSPTLAVGDDEEIAADRFALELLTGFAKPQVMPSPASSYNAPSLAAAALNAAAEAQIEPGTLALCFGYATGSWAVVNAAMRFIYTSPKPVWQEVNKVALRELDLKHLPDDTGAFLMAVLGAAG